MLLKELLYWFLHCEYLIAKTVCSQMFLKITKKCGSLVEIKKIRVFNQIISYSENQSLHKITVYQFADEIR